MMAHVLRKMILIQIFTLLAVLAIPFLVRILPGAGGKILYGLLTVACVGLAIVLRRSLSELDVQK